MKKRFLFALPLVAVAAGLFLLGNAPALAQTGNVGIGTTAPQSKLHTAGGVRHDTLAGNGPRLVFADAQGRLYAPAPSNFTSAGPVPIPDAGCIAGDPGISTIAVSGMLPVLSANIRVRVSISHPYTDLNSCYIISPSADTLALLVDLSGFGPLDIIFWDGAVNYATSASAAGGVYKPQGAMGTFCSMKATVSTFGAMGSGGSINPNGVWKLLVYDFHAPDPGTIEGWAITFDGSEPRLTAGAFSNNVLPKSNGTALVNSNVFDVAGRVGIGTATPTAQLDVTGKIRMRTGSDTLASWSSLTLQANDDNSGTEHMGFAIGMTERMRIAANGNVGIGTTTPLQKLQVDGTVAATAFAGDGAGLANVVNTTTAQTINGVKTFSASLIATGAVGIGVAPPLRPLHISATGSGVQLIESSSANGTWSSLSNTTAGGGIWNLISSGAGNGEGAGKLLIHSTVGGGTTATFQSNGNVGIGTSSPISRLTLDGGTGDAFTILAGGDVRIFNDAGTASALLYAAGGTGTNNATLTALSDGKVFSLNGTGGSVSSDRRLKQDITPLENSLEKVLRLNGYTYRFKTKAHVAQKEAGVIAQEVQTVLPEAVSENADGTLAVSYNSLVPLLINAVKEQQALIKNLQETAKATEAANTVLREDVAELSGQMQRVMRAMTPDTAGR